MGFLGLGEPSLGTLIICAGAWINRDFTTPLIQNNQYVCEDVGQEMVLHSKSKEDGSSDRHARWRSRNLSLFGYTKTIETPDTSVFRSRILSRVLLRFPFIMEIVYWGLTYGVSWLVTVIGLCLGLKTKGWQVYQFGRGQLAIRFVDQTIDIACYHALAVINFEKRLHIFWELPIQKFFLQHSCLMWWINRVYSFVHLPATISFLVGLYYFAITRNRPNNVTNWHIDITKGPELYETRRRALALCNLFAFCVFSTWPCMPPRLLRESTLQGDAGKLARSLDFVDTVHARDGAISVFNTHKWTNQLAAMPSLHFGYSLLIGVSMMQYPVASSSKRYKVAFTPMTLLYPNAGFHIRPLSWLKFICQIVGFLYPLTILIAIIATANHFILDAAAGGLTCLFALRCNGFMKNLLPFEDYVFWCLRIHKPSHHAIAQREQPDEHPTRE